MFKCYSHNFLVPVKYIKQTLNYKQYLKQQKVPMLTLMIF